MKMSYTQTIEVILALESISATLERIAKALDVFVEYEINK